MIEEVVNSILEAEDAAEKKIAQAKVQANEIVSAAEINADAFKKSQSAENKRNYAEKSRQIDEQSGEKAKQYLAEQKALTDKQIDSYEKNVDAAVKIILESF
ncbi:MAG: hypothetical protein NC132_01785 [Corallococcus sp.]|nr:hypothetical protein [Corallococcus sp.]MCM1359389.1 hypothetical protein [Corallococcus sp.]MCM1394832.1 hypothetical protein [Corallococcus sp.]